MKTTVTTDQTVTQTMLPMDLPEATSRAINRITGKHVAVIGLRDETVTYDFVAEKLQELCGGGPVTILTGGNAGVDAHAERFAVQNGINAKVVPANWDELGKSAGFRRNESIIGQATEVLVFTDGKDSATMSAASFARRIQKPLTVINLKSKVLTNETI